MTQLGKESAGPWSLDSAKDGQGIYYIIEGHVPKGLSEKDSYNVADTMNRHFCISPEEDEANAKILSAAWDMANILLRAHSTITHGGPTRGEVEAVLRKAGIL